MKICKYCATKAEDNITRCLGCGSEEFYYIVDDDSANVNKPHKPSLIKFLKMAPKKIRIAVAIGCVLLVFLASLNIYQHFHPDLGPVYDTEGLKLGFKNIGELATQAGYYTEIVSEEDYRQFFNTNLNVPGTKRHVIVSYNGVIKAGIDFEKIEFEVDKEAKMIKIRLPEVKVLSNALDHNSMKVWYEQLNVFNPSTHGATNELYLKLEESGEEHAIENGLLTNAIMNAKTIIENVCRGQLPEYRVEFVEEN